MRTQTVDVRSSVGKVLCMPVFQPTGKKLLAKGHQLSEDDVRLLDSEGYQEVLVAVLEENEVPEDEAAVQIACEAACGSMEIHVAAGGRANLYATEPSCLLVDDQALHELNRSGCITMATNPNFSFAVPGQRVASVKTQPFAVKQSEFDPVVRFVKDKGPIMQGRPTRNPTVAVLYSDPRRAERGRQLFEGIMKTRLERLGASATFVLSSIETEEAVARALQHLLRARPAVVLMASTTAPAGPEDVVGRAIQRVGCTMESFLAPVEPGNLLLLAYAGDIPVVAAPGCFRSPKPNVIDLILPPLLARYRVSASEIAALGHGGLLL